MEQITYSVSVITINKNVELLIFTSSKHNAVVKHNSLHTHNVVEKDLYMMEHERYRDKYEYLQLKKEMRECGGTLSAPSFQRNKSHNKISTNINSEKGTKTVCHPANFPKR